MPLLEAIEQRASAQGVPVDARVARGRTYRHALQRLLDDEPVDRVIVSATAQRPQGLTGDDLVWLLEQAPAEVLILRPDPDDHRKVTGEAVRGPLLGWRAPPSRSPSSSWCSPRSPFRWGPTFSVFGGGRRVALEGPLGPAERGLYRLLRVDRARTRVGGASTR